jgi:hypothetical protein
MINSDRVVVVKADGTRLGETQATVTDGLIVIHNVAPQIDEGDTIIHMRENGDDRYRVVEAVYYAGTGAHYQLRVEKSDS